MWEIHMDWLTFSSCVALSVSLNLPVLPFLVQKRDRPFLSDRVISKTQWEGTTQGWHSVRSRLYYGKVLDKIMKHQAPGYKTISEVEREEQGLSFLSFVQYLLPSFTTTVSGFS